MICRKCKEKLERGKNWFPIYSKEGYNVVGNLCKICDLGERQRRRMDLKFSVLAIYSEGQPECSCCGEEIFEFLTIDHMNGRTKEEKTLGSKRKGYYLYVWLIRNNFPEGYKVLCFNCNSGKQLNHGICPHEEIHNVQSST